MSSSNGYWMGLLDYQNDITLAPNETSTEISPNEQQLVDISGSEAVSKKRGKYEKHSESVRARVIKAAENEEDWVAVATANGVHKSTADNWVRKGIATHKSRGGLKQSVVKIQTAHVEFLIDLLNENALRTLKEMAKALHEKFQLLVSLKTISRHLDGRMISLKMLHYQPVAANSVENKRLRKEYVEKFLKVNHSHGLFLSFQCS